MITSYISDTNVNEHISNSCYDNREDSVCFPHLQRNMLYWCSNARYDHHSFFYDVTSIRYAMYCHWNLVHIYSEYACYAPSHVKDLRENDDLIILFMLALSINWKSYKYIIFDNYCFTFSCLWYWFAIKPCLRCFSINTFISTLGGFPLFCSYSQK